jgi:hypothetical protein
MHQNFLVIAGLLILPLVSEMLGLGVAFAAIPFLGLFLADLVHQAPRAGLKPGATR